MERQHTRILVIGEGIGARTVAFLLRQSGYSVMEAEHSKNVLPEGVFLAENGMSLFTTVGEISNAFGDRDTYSDLLERSAFIREKITYDPKGKTSREQFSRERVQAWEGMGCLGLHWPTWKERFQGSSEIKFPYISLKNNSEQGVTVKSRQGEKRFDLVVAADGPMSSLRNDLFDTDEFQDTGRSVWYFLSRLEDSPYENSSAIQIIREEASLFHYSIELGIRASIVVVPQSFDANIGVLQGVFGSAAKEVLQGFVEGSLQTIPLKKGHVSKRSSGSVVLLGSAAYSLYPMLGQDASMEIEDARALQIALDRSSSIAEALSTFETLRRERVTAIFEASWAQAEMEGSQSTSLFRKLFHHILPPPREKFRSQLMNADDLEWMISHRPELAPLTEEARNILRFLIKIGQVDGRFDEAERAFAKASLVEIGYNITSKDLTDLEAETRAQKVSRIMQPFQEHPQDFREQLLRIGVLLAAESGRVTADEHKALREACTVLRLSQETLAVQLKDVIEAKDLNLYWMERSMSDQIQW